MDMKMINHQYYHLITSFIKIVSQPRSSWLCLTVKIMKRTRFSVGNQKFYFIIIYVASQKGDDSFCLQTIYHSK